jgi:transcription initiation factor TFIIIB Brf1 subunit/transcription initiation factor TFIIB
MSRARDDNDVNDEIDDLFKEFDEFDEYIDQDDEEEADKHSESSSSEKNIKICTHANLVNEMGTMLCSDCGVELKKIMSYEKDWRYYGTEDTRKNSDPNRCHIRKMEDKSIFKDVESYGFSEKIVNMANDIYMQVTKGKIFRGNSRKAIIFGCIMHSVKHNGRIYTCDTLREIFQLDRKLILKGIKYVNLNAPKDSQIRTKDTSSNELVEECIHKFDMTLDDKKEIYELYNKIKNKSTIINRSRPQSVTSSLIYYYICKKRGFNNVNIKDFVKKVNLSELTINKISKEIAKIVSV